MQLSKLVGRLPSFPHLMRDADEELEHRNSSSGVAGPLHKQIDGSRLLHESYNQQHQQGRATAGIMPEERRKIAWDHMLLNFPRLAYKSDLWLKLLQLAYVLVAIKPGALWMNAP